ncbi:hypothetical protein ABZV91_11050 [Nocardia sp. NPDC004568]|uniref:hypothetical protein n=1 Tax=Nocardia sp. NPDC004568 TaxID=3154551 RepID=UPI0033AE0A0D
MLLVGCVDAGLLFVFEDGEAGFLFFLWIIGSLVVSAKVSMVLLRWAERLDEVRDRRELPEIESSRRAGWQAGNQGGNGGRDIDSSGGVSDCSGSTSCGGGGGGGGCGGGGGGS